VSGGHEPVGYCESAAQLEHAATVVVGGAATGIRIGPTVACAHIELAGAVGGRGAAAHPDARTAPVRCDVQHRCLREKGAVIAVPQDPAVVLTESVKGSPGDVDESVDEHEACTLPLLARIEGDARTTAAAARPRITAHDEYR